MRKILVTGGSGFLGSRICRYFREKNDVVFAPTHEEMDITDRESVSRCLDSFQPEWVIHCAAISDTVYTEKNKEESFLVNVAGTENLAAETGKRGIRFLFMSSDQIYNGKTIAAAVYDKTVDANQEEKDDCPITEYGRQKKLAEELGLQKNPRTIALRLTWMYDLPREGLKNNQNLLVQLLCAKETKQKLRYARHEYRGITNVWEVVSQLEKVMQLPAGIYNYGSENTLSTIEIVRNTLAGEPSFAEQIEEDEERFAARPRNLTMCCDKIRRAGITFRDTKEGLQQTFASDS